MNDSLGWSSQASLWILLLPFCAFVVNGIFLGHRSPKLAAGLATLATAGSALLSICIAIPLLQVKFLQGIIPWSFEWLQIGIENSPQAEFQISMGMYLDGLSLVMLCLVSFLSFLVHFYSLAYMQEDKGLGRFFTLLPLFTFAMLGMVAASNLVQIFVFWELVGACSYFLIGFWFHKPSAIRASKKAFWITSFSDVFFLAGLLLLAVETRDLNIAHLISAETIQQLLQSPGFWGISRLSWAAMLLLIGAWGKSALFPLHIWLPDAMEGPTPVSSLLHSATMVVAGVFLMARFTPLLQNSQIAMTVTMTAGLTTAAFAALVACFQWDIKRILAFSTVSQLGYMLFALGCSGAGLLAYQASVFHIFTHAFAKCMLFLCAGVVIHSIHFNDLRKMGGLGKTLPLTCIAFWIGVLSLSGVPGFSGFFSKEAIVQAAWNSSYHWQAVTAVMVGGISSFYLARLALLTFHGPTDQNQSKLSPSKYKESFVWMTPIVILAALTLGAGWLSHQWFEKQFYIKLFDSLSLGENHAAAPAALVYVAIAVAGLGLLLALAIFRGPRRHKLPTWSHPLQNGLYLDTLAETMYQLVFHKFLGPLFYAFDKWIIDAAVNSCNQIFHFFARYMRQWHNGQVQRYAFVSAIGFVFLFIIAHFFLTQSGMR